MEKAMNAHLPSCQHEAAAIKEISRALELISHLEAHLCPLILAKKGMEQASNLFQEITSSLLESSTILDPGAAAQVASKKVKTINHEDGTTVKKRRHKDLVAFLTTEPFFDGYQWKKYGQKDRKNSMFQRTYYKCLNEKCKATKTVQQEDHHEPPNFLVTYGMQHTCNIAEFTQKFRIDSSTSTRAFGPIVESNSFTVKNN